MMHRLHRRIGLFLVLFLAGQSAGDGLAQDAPRPNVIVFIADDVSWNDFGCYGNVAARTPNIDALAENGIRFTGAFLTASSCSPSRASIITGRYPHNNGKAAELHHPIAGHLPWFPALLKEAGYHTAVSGKNHMSPGEVPDGHPMAPKAFDVIDAGRVIGNRGGHGNWQQMIRKRPEDQPFFFWFASYDAHRGWEADAEWRADEYGPKHKPEDVIVPPFLVDDTATRQDLASYYNEVTRFDHYIGVCVDELRTQGLLDDTLIFVLADNGRPFPRAKTRIHDSGMKTALIAHWPAGIRTRGATSDSLVSVIDLAPTILRAAGLAAVPTMQGVAMQPLFDDPATSIRRYAFSEHNWHDYEAHGRGVRTTDWLLIRNRRPYQAWQGPADSVRSPSHASLQAARDGKTLTAAQADVFLAPRPALELYRLRDDPHQLNNLAGEPSFARTKAELLEVLDRWESETADSTPKNLSTDQFDRESGKQLFQEAADYRGTTPGEDTGAILTNAPGPR